AERVHHVTADGLILVGAGLDERRHRGLGFGPHLAKRPRRPRTHVRVFVVELFDQVLDAFAGDNGNNADDPEHQSKEGFHAERRRLNGKPTGAIRVSCLITKDASPRMAPRGREAPRSPRSATRGLEPVFTLSQPPPLFAARSEPRPARA